MGPGTAPRPVQGRVPQSPNLLSLLARLLCDSTGPLVRRQLGREFDQAQRTIGSVRGRFKMRESSLLIARRTPRVHCRFNELTVDTPRNRLIKAMLHRLASDPRVATAATAEQATDLRRRLLQRMQEMGGVRLAAVDASSFSAIRLSRNDQAYRLPLAICRLVHDLHLPTESDSDHAFVALVRDELVFPDLFERFLRNFYRIHLGGWTSRREHLAWPLEAPSALWPGMNTDVTLERRDGSRRIVLDAKFYRDMLIRGPHSAGAKLRADHLYQLYAYLRTQEERPERRFAESAGVLVYPAVRWSLNELVTIQGHRMGAMTGDLARPWP